MKTILTFLFSIFFIALSFGQSNYIEYAVKMRVVRKMLSNEEYEAAYDKFKASAENFDYVKADDLRLFSAICLNVGKCDEGLQAYQQAVSRGFNFNDDYLEFFKQKCTNFNREFENILIDLKSDYLGKLNISYRDSVLKYYQLDQNVRRRYNAGLCSDIELKTTDSIVINSIWPFIEKYGIGDERLIGLDAANNLFIILLHFDADQSNNLGPYLLDALMNGKIKPENYAWIIDRRRVWGNHLKPYYYQIPNGVDKLDNKEIEEINRRRSIIGCRSLAEYDIKRENDGTWIMNEK